MIRAMYENKDLRGNLALGTGSYFAANYAAEPQWAQFVYEGYAGMRLWERGGLWLDAGVLPSIYGYEGAISQQQINLTRSFSAENSPYYLSGARLTGTWEDWSATLALLNGWQNIAETNGNKSLGTQVQFRPAEAWLINWSSYYGDLPNQTDNRRKQLFNDFYVHYRPSDRFEAVALFDFGFQQQRSEGPLDEAFWHTANLTGRYHFAEKWALGGRVEYFSDSRSAIITPETKPERGFTVQGASLNLDYQPRSQAQLRVELKQLWSDEAVFRSESNEGERSALSLAVSLSLYFD